MGYQVLRRTFARSRRLELEERSCTTAPSRGHTAHGVGHHGLLMAAGSWHQGHGRGQDGVECREAQETVQRLVEIVE